MRIALIRPGIHQTDIDFARNLSKLGNEIFILIPEYTKIKKMRNDKFKIIKYQTYNFSFLNSFPFPKNLHKLLKEIDAQIIQPNEDFQMYSWIAERYCKENKKPLVIIEEKYTYPNFFNKFAIRIIDFLGLTDRVWKNSKAIISHGSETTKFLINRGCKKKIINLPICVDTHIFPKKSKYDKNSKLKLITVARFIPHKALDILVDALREKDNIHLTIIGRGVLKKDILKQIRKNKLNEKIKIIDHVNHSKLRNYFHKSDVYVCSSRREVASTTIPEAMSAGLPIICTDAGSSKDFVIDKVNGFIFKSENALDLRSKINNFIVKPSLIEKMGRNSANICRNKFAYDKRIKEYLEVLNK